ncbi:MAG TPA: bifunctional DNA-formamidopyrimidine glycosylase/DNA-(apurinic or apyrimidinic site) lyase [Candidatus Limnocylindria bacterium]|jgi:formamidopyrimidine-DNA glycosylase|nr:bifunctional DNA-formamidopyrimidine glycosylase/DNA-(apurinic or apyrimidinic site) lyase [Candidatus Limnocylindria bacterium]
MPELPEVEVLVRHLRPRVTGRTIVEATLHRSKSGRPESPASFRAKLKGATIAGVRRRAKNLLFDLTGTDGKPWATLVGHLGMTGRMYVAPEVRALPKHTVVTLDLGEGIFIFEDTRYFGRMHFDLSGLEALGPEPLDDAFTPAMLALRLKGSRQPIKVKLLDQEAIAGVGNIYASEALWLAQIGPKRLAGGLKKTEIERLHCAIREVLTEAIRFGSTVPLGFSSDGKNDGLFYYGSVPGDEAGYEERLRVYDRAGQPCLRCGKPIQRIVQASRSTFFCPACQKSGRDPR